MKGNSVLLCAVSLGATVSCLLYSADSGTDLRSDAHLRAMSDELMRAKTLELNKLDKPYFIQFTSSDADQVTISGSLGGITSSSRVQARQPRVQVRVGDYKFDNTNSIFSGFPSIGTLPLDDDYDAIRMELWLMSDGMYKLAADQITRKRNALRDLAESETEPDFAPAKPVHILQEPSALKIDQKTWEAAIRKLSGRFATHSAITSSRVHLRAIGSTYRLVNTEGTVVRIPQELTDLEITASGLAPDGSRVWNHHFIVVLKPSELPAGAELSQLVDGLASETDRLVKAPLAEDYSGPVLFAGDSAGQAMAQVLTDALRLHRKPVAPQGSNAQGIQALESVWASRLGSKVVPEWLSILDDPHQKRVGQQVLAGQYDVDDEGVPADPLTLVDKGILKSFLLSRQPIRTFNVSNGRGRLPGGFGAQQAAFGNLFLRAEQTNSEAALKARLLEKVKASGLQYGLIIRKLDFPSTATLQDLQAISRQQQKNGFSRTISAPLLAYRVYPDGHEELVRGLRFKEFSAKDLRDLESAGDSPYVFNYVNNGSSFNWTELGSDATTSSVICPSLLFDNVELARAEGEATKLPIVPPPALTSQQ
jgi:TldD protein